MKRIILFVVLVGTVGFVLRDWFLRRVFEPTESFVKEGVMTLEMIESAPEVVASGLEIPWEIEFLPGGDMLVTERPGRLLRIGAETKVLKEIEGVEHVGEGGLLGMALHPSFSRNGYVYLYLTTQVEGGLQNRVERYELVGDALVKREVILEGIEGARFHDGGRIEFGPDGFLYITTGDAGVPESSQDTKLLSGKILRVTDEGGVPGDNPFGNSVYSYGHRNAQGLAWDRQGRLWVTEHGPSGFSSGYDELNLIEKGANYGWPEARGDEILEGVNLPIIQSGSAETWAPAGMDYYEGSLFFVGLRGEAIYEYEIESGQLMVHFRGEFGRLRVAKVGEDGYLYVATSNRDGRGKVQAGDDKIVRINLSVF